MEVQMKRIAKLLNTFGMEVQMKRIAKLLDHAVQKLTGSVEAGACVPNAFTCCFTPGYEHNCYGNCLRSSFC
jgi:hypothetical protein